jgi:DNA sulfur modification protein DndD
MRTSRLLSIKMRNFGPYKGAVEVDFPAPDAGPLVLFHGQNMHGKTSFLNAIRWCLYGEAFGRDRKHLSSLDLLNFVARDGKEYVFSVECRFQVEDESGEVSEIQLTRTGQPKSGVREPSSKADFRDALEIKVDGAVKAAAEYDDYVNQFFPKDISRFFLFDGELLGEYEELVRSSESEQSKKVKLAIEHVLGVPAAKNAKADLQYLEREASKKYDTEAAKSETAKEAATAHQEVEKKIERKQKERLTLQGQLEEAEAKRSELRSDLGKVEHLQQGANEIKSLESQLKAEGEKQTASQARIKEMSGNVWRDVLRARVDGEINSLGKEHDRLSEEGRNVSVLRERIEEAEQALKKNECPTCGSVTGPKSSEAKTLKKRLSKLEIDLKKAEKGFDEERLGSITGTMATLRKVAPAGVTTGILSEEKAIEQSVIASQRISREKEKIVGLMKDQDPSRISQYQDALAKVDNKIGNLDGKIESLDKEIEELESDRKRLDDEMRKHETPGLEELRLRKDLLSGAIEMVDSSIDDLVSSLRNQVEKKATDVFLKLTSDSSYKGLRINENYGLTIIGSRNKEIPVRSAGAENIVAFSLIAALKELSFQQAPVIMDTPIGRLDETHRESVLAMIPRLGEQVMLLVHDGELKRGGDLYAKVASQIAAEKEIIHTKSEESDIRAVS